MGSGSARARMVTSTAACNKPLRRHVWAARQPMTKAHLDREREEYYDTRVSGRPEAWNAIRLAIETMATDLLEAQAILDAAGVTLPTGKSTAQSLSGRQLYLVLF